MTARAAVAAVLLAVACGPAREPPPPQSTSTTYRVERLLVLPISSLGNLSEFRGDLRSTVALAFSARADSVLALDAEHDADLRGETSVPPAPSGGSEVSYARRCRFGPIRRELAAVGEGPGCGDVHALCVDLRYRRRPPDEDTLQVAEAAGRIWSARADSVVWRDTAVVASLLPDRPVDGDTIRSLLTEAVIRLRDSLP